MKLFMIAAATSLFISTSAMAVGWGCNDQEGRFWQFTATGFNSGVATSTRGASPMGFSGTYADFNSKIHWTMYLGEAGYTCDTDDHGGGSRFNCNRTYGPDWMPGWLYMSNCNSIFFFNEDALEGTQPEAQG